MQENHYARYQMQHVFPPRPFGERVGVRGQRARDPTSARQCKKTIMHGIRGSTFSPSPLWGVGRGEGAARTRPHTSPEMQENHYARYQMQHVFPPRPFGERVGVRGQRARDPTPARRCKKTIMHGIRCSTFSPSPLWGEGRGEGAAGTRPHTSPEMQENHYARYQMQHVFPPRPFGERVGVRGAARM